MLGMHAATGDRQGAKLASFAAQRDHSADEAAERGALRLRAIALRDLAEKASVAPGTPAAGDLDRGKAEIRGAIADIGRHGTSLRAIRSQLQLAAVTVSHALFVGGVTHEGHSVMELRISLAAWFEGVD